MGTFTVKYAVVNSGRVHVTVKGGKITAVELDADSYDDRSSAQYILDLLLHNHFEFERLEDALTTALKETK